MTADLATGGDAPKVGEDDLPFRQLAQHLASPCWISDPEGQITWVNEAWIAYTGADVETIRRDGLKGLHDPAVYGEVVRKWEIVKARGVADEMVFPLKARDGTFRLFHTRVTPLPDRDSRIAHWFGVNTDVSARSETESRLRSSEEQLREVFERAGDGIFITDAQGALIEVNPTGCAMSQYSRDEILAKSVWDLIEPAEHATLADARDQEASTREWRIRRGDGTLLDVEISSRRLSDGRRIGLVRDISARKLAQQQERQAMTDLLDAQTARAGDAERHLQNFWDASRDLFAVVSDEDGRPRLINERAWRETLGYSSEELASMHLIDLVHPDDRGMTLAMRNRRLQDRSYYGFENRYRRKDGGWAWLSWNVVREAGLIYCSARDVSAERKARLELRKANERLANAQKMETIGQLTGGVAHDFNNLLMVMGGQAQLLRERVGDDPRVLRALDAIDASARRGQELTRHLLAFARRQRLKPASVSLAARAAGLETLLAASLGENVSLSIDWSKALWTVEVDVNQLELAVLNLAVNARDAMPAGGRLSVTAKNVAVGLGDLEGDIEGDFVALTVSDTGVGIPADILPKVIEPFFTTKPVNKGTGLGLSQVYGFVQQSGGRMTIESELGQGSRVTLYLPRSRARPRPTPEVSPAPAARDLDILCVEDNPEVAEVAAGLLERLGHRARVVSSASAAMQILDESGPPDLVFSDIVMAGEIDGLALARHVRQKWPAVPILLATGYSRAAEAIGDEFPILTKPYQIDELSRALCEALVAKR